MRPTLDNLPALYEYFRSCRPFNRWKLPPSDAISFRIVTTKAYYGQYVADRQENCPHTIDLSVKCTHHDTISVTLAHEMLHLAQRVRKKDRGGDHNADFQKWARVIAKEFGWDTGDF